MPPDRPRDNRGWLVLQRDLAADWKDEGHQLRFATLVLDAASGRPISLQFAARGAQSLRAALDEAAAAASQGGSTVRAPSRILCAVGLSEPLGNQLTALAGRPGLDAVPPVEEIEPPPEAEDMFDAAIGVLTDIRPPAEYPTPADSRFLFEQVRRYVERGPWLRWSDNLLLLELKVGAARNEVCAQIFGEGAPHRGLFLFPGRRGMRALFEAGMAEPSAGTILLQLYGEDETPAHAAATARRYGWPDGQALTPSFMTIRPDGWAHIERRQARLLAAALAGIIAHDARGSAAAEDETLGDLTFPEGSRGRYRVRKAPPAGPEAGGKKDSMVVARLELGGLVPEDSTITFAAMAWDLFRSVRQRARVHHPAKLPFKEVGERVPMIAIEASPRDGPVIARRLAEMKVRGLLIPEHEGNMMVTLMGEQRGYVVHVTEAHDERILRWRHLVRLADGAHIIVVTGSSPRMGTGEEERWEPEVVYGLFECRLAVEPARH